VWPCSLKYSLTEALESLVCRKGWKPPYSSQDETTHRPKDKAMNIEITQETYTAAYQRAHEERAKAAAKAWNWLFSSKKH